MSRGSAVRAMDVPLSPTLGQVWRLPGSLSDHGDSVSPSSPTPAPASLSRAILPAQASRPWLILGHHLAAPAEAVPFPSGLDSHPRCPSTDIIT